MAETIELGGISIELTRKDIKNVHLSVRRPNGSVRISAPRRMSLDTIRVFAISKLGWIKRHQEKLRAQERETPREYLDRESHYVWGQRYLLRIEAREGRPEVALQHGTLLLRVRPGADTARRQAVLEAWYREQIRAEIPTLIARWESVMGVKVAGFYVQRMKTRWGSCTPRARTIRLNSELAKKPPECLEYVVVHELAHLLVPSHDARFVALMDRFLPHWRHARDILNRFPVRHEAWEV